MKILKITGEAARKAACREILAVPEGWVVRISEPVKKREQEEKYHAMIGDIAKQDTKKGYGPDVWKRLLCASYVRVARENAAAEGKPDPFRGRGLIIPNLEGDGFVQISVATSDFTVRQASDFIEHLFAWGAQQDPPVRWSDLP
jgi:hypothetical protein